MKTPLTDRQQQVFEIIQEHIREHGYAPTMRELADRLGILPMGAQHHVEAIIKKGWIDARPHRRARALHITDPADRPEQERRPRPTGKLTARQAGILRFLSKFTAQHGYPPSMRETMQNFGFSSLNSLRCHYEAMEKKGYIVVQPYSDRAVKILWSADNATQPRADDSERTHPDSEQAGTTQDALSRIRPAGA